MLLENGMFGGGAFSPHARQNQPRSWVRTVKKPDIDWKFHHVISWDALRDTWQGLLTYQCWDALQSYLAALGVSAAAAKRGKLHREEPLDQLEVDEVYQKLSWPSWNIVEGPADRTDEGGSELDLFQEGMTAAHQMRHTDIGLLWTAMSDFLSKLDRSKLKVEREREKDGNTPQVRLPFSRSVADAAERLRLQTEHMKKHANADVIPYVASMWKFVTVGHVRKDAPNAWVDNIRPTFCKQQAAVTFQGDLPPKMGCQKCKSAFPTPNVVVGTMYPCPACGTHTLIDFRRAAN